MLMRRLRPGNPTLQFLADAARHGDQYGLPAPVLIEVSYGAHATDSRGGRRLIYLANWIDQLTTRRGGNVLHALDVTSRAAIAAGRILATLPMPRKRRQGDATQQGRGWAHDVLIAATAWANGYDLVSADSDYQTIAAALPQFRVESPAALGFP